MEKIDASDLHKLFTKNKQKQAAADRKWASSIKYGRANCNQICFKSSYLQKGPQTNFILYFAKLGSNATRF